MAEAPFSDAAANAFGDRGLPVPCGLREQARNRRHSRTSSNSKAWLKWLVRAVLDLLITHETNGIWS